MSASISAPQTASRTDILMEGRGLERTFVTGEVSVRALRGVDISLKRGELVVLLGHSGSGKSTLLNILGGLDRATAGTLHFDGHDLTHASDDELTRYRRRSVGFVFQFYNLVAGLTAKENVSLVTEIAKNPMKPEEALGLVDLGDRVEHFPAQLSGGEQQRLAIARAVAKRPRVLFCDEPTGALDSTTGRAVLKVLKDVNETLGTTVLIITHAAATAGMAHRVIHFADGDIREIEENETRLDPEQIEW